MSTFWGWVTGSALRITAAALSSAVLVGGGLVAADKAIQPSNQTSVGVQALHAGASGTAGAAAGGKSSGASAGTSVSAAGTNSSNGVSVAAGAPTAPGTPGLPAVSPALPSVNPALPSVKPSVPTLNPSLPAVNPSLPAVNPSLPAVNPSLPAVNPSLPAVNPSVPSLPVPTVSQPGLPPYDHGAASISVPAVPGVTYQFCLSGSLPGSCKTVSVPTVRAMQLGLSYGLNGGLAAPTFSTGACKGGFTLTVAGLTPGATVSATTNNDVLTKSVNGLAETETASFCQA